MKRFSLTKHLLSRVIAYLCVFSMIVSMVPAAYAAEGTGDAQESDLLVHLREEIATYIDTYGLSPEMPDSALANAYFSLDSDASYAAWTTANALIEEANGLSEEEGQILASEVNTMLGLRFYNVMNSINFPVMIATDTFDFTPIDGIAVHIDSEINPGADGYTANPPSKEESCVSGTVTVYVRSDYKSNGCSGTSYNHMTDTVTVTNTAAYNANVTFHWTKSNKNVAVVIDGTSTGTNTSGDYAGEIPAGASITITVESYDSTNDSNFTMSAFTSKEALDQYNITVQYPEGQSVTMDGNAVNSGQTVQVPATGAVFSASSTNFAAWVDGNNKILPLDEDGKLTYVPAEDTTLKALYYTAAGIYKAGDYMFDDFNATVTHAASATNKVVALLNNVTFAAGDYTIPAGVTFLIPYDADNTARSTPSDMTVMQGSIAGVVAYEDRGISNKLFRTLTLATGANMVVKGELEVGGRTHPQGRGTLGDYAQITMESGSKITVEEGGTLSAWGFIKGSGTAEVKSGGTVYENLNATDYPGGADKLNSLNEAGAFPLTEFVANNVEVPMTVNSGAKLRGYMVIYGGNIKYNGFTKTIIGSTTDDMLQLTSGTITKTYVSSRQKIFLNGQGTINPLKIEASLFGIGIKINSATTGLPIPATWDFVFESGKVTVNNTLLLMAGSTMTVNSGAEVEIPEGVSIHVLDADQDPSAVAADAKIVVNGTVTVNGAVDVTEGGASITSTGGGKIVYNADCAAGSVIVKKSATEVETLSTIPLKLTNANSTLVDTAGTTAGTTYTYSEGFWCTGHDYRETEIKDPTCLANGEKSSVCSICGKVKKDAIPASGHTFGSVVGAKEATCLAVGNVEYKQCTVCKLYFAGNAENTSTDGKADNTSFVIAQKQHSYTGEIKSDGDGKDATHSFKCVNGCDGYGNAVKHTWVAGEITKEPTCTETGVKTFTCTVDGCGGTYTEVMDMLDTVAMIGEVPYASLQAAIDALGGNGGTIRLMMNTTEEIVVENPEKPIVILRSSIKVDNGADTAAEAAYLSVTDDNYDIVKTYDAYVLGPVDGFVFEMANVHMGNSLEMQFAFNASGFGDVQDYQVRIDHVTRHNGEIKTVSEYVSLEEMIPNDNYMIVSYKGLVAKQMSDVITLTVCDSDKNPISNPWVDSMRGYAMRIYEKTTYLTQKKLVAAFLNYGAAAQQKFTYAAEDLANRYIVEDASLEVTVPAVEPVTENAPIFSNLNLELSFAFDIGFAYKSEELDREHIVVEVSYTDHYGKPVNVVKKAGEAKTKDAEDNEVYFYYVHVDELAVADVCQMVTVKAYANEEAYAKGESFAECQESIAIYLDRYEDDPAPAVMKFAIAAYDFLHTDK